MQRTKNGPKLINSNLNRILLVALAGHGRICPLRPAIAAASGRNVAVGFAARARLVPLGPVAKANSFWIVAGLLYRNYKGGLLIGYCRLNISPVFCISQIYPDNLGGLCHHCVSSGISSAISINATGLGHHFDAVGRLIRGAG
jgi:hypothetical protein